MQQRDELLYAGTEVIASAMICSSSELSVLNSQNIMYTHHVHIPLTRALVGLVINLLTLLILMTTSSKV